MIIIDQQEIEKRIKIKFPNQPFEIIEYTKVSKPFTIKCLKCGVIKKHSNFNNFINAKRNGICACYSKHIQNKQQIINLFEHHDYLTLVSFGYREDVKKYTGTIYCNHCNTAFTTSWQILLKHQSCPFCDEHHQLNENVINRSLPEGYKIIGKYIGYDKKIRIKHCCGFEYYTTPHLIMGNHLKSCPKCFSHGSKGERKISEILFKYKIPFIQEKTFEWQNNKRRYDFYLPEQNCVIEYMGEQHFEERNFFNIKLSEQLKIDEEKKQAALQHGLQYYRIDYMDFPQIESILKSWFNDYLVREQG